MQGDSRSKFFSWGGYHHHLAVNVWIGGGAGQRPAGKAGLAHVVIGINPDPYAAAPQKALPDPCA